jgi:hypothetical protein
VSIAVNIGGVFGPGDLTSATNQLLQQVTTIGQEIFSLPDDFTGASDVDGFTPGWNEFANDFRDWRDSNGVLASVLNSTRNDLVGFFQRYNQLRTRWATIFPGSVSTDFDVTSETLQGDLKSAGAAIGATVGAAVKPIASALSPLIIEIGLAVVALVVLVIVLHKHGATVGGLL